MKSDLDETLANIRAARRERNRKLFDRMAEHNRQLGDAKFVDPDDGIKSPRYFVTPSQKHWMEAWEEEESK